ncbi:hypothetical protein BDW59DRAFT_28145 [Aspergillus cavernicola]|uniref:Uncharacterized protein n=1 Tax=Aspergillus cavernicola TaxID=176166 RepID=A0ABR4HE92_9EURO
MPCLWYLYLYFVYAEFTFVIQPLFSLMHLKQSTLRTYIVIVNRLLRSCQTACSIHPSMSTWW